MKTKPALVHEDSGYVGRTRWHTELYDSEKQHEELASEASDIEVVAQALRQAMGARITQCNVVHVEMHRWMHPQARRALADHLDRNVDGLVRVTLCPHGAADGWHEAVHVELEPSEVLRDVAETLAAIVDRHRVGWLHSRWLSFRSWLARVIEP